MVVAQQLEGAAAWEIKLRGVSQAGLRTVLRL